MAAKRRAVRRSRAKKDIAWYIGYDVKEEERDDVVKIASRIHELRRSVAVAAYQYYELDDITISDHEYESRVLELHYLQLRYPKIASTVLFMPRAFSTDGFVSTGFHLVEHIRDGDMGGENIPGISSRLLGIAAADKEPVFESRDVNQKIKHFQKKIKQLSSS